MNEKIYKNIIIGGGIAGLSLGGRLKSDCVIIEREEALGGLEGLEQLRFLENGETVKCVQVEGRGRVFWELNNPEDVARIEGVIEQ